MRTESLNQTDCSYLNKSNIPYGFEGSFTTAAWLFIFTYIFSIFILGAVIVYLYLYIVIGDPVIKRRIVGIPLIGWIPPHFHQVRTWISNVIYCGLFCVQWFEVRGHCSLCWYWKKCCPSLFKISVHNIMCIDYIQSVITV